MLLIKKMINLCSFFKWAIPASFHLFTVFYSVKYNNFYRKLMWKNVHLVWCAGNQTHGLLIWVPSHDDYTRVPTLYYILIVIWRLQVTRLVSIPSDLTVVGLKNTFGLEVTKWSKLVLRVTYILEEWIDSTL